jgi:hypothetical protein
MNTDSVYLVITRDYNCDINSRFYPAFMQLATKNHLVWSDNSRMANVITYCSDNGLNCSWIEHIVYA